MSRVGCWRHYTVLELLHICVLFLAVLTRRLSSFLYLSVMSRMALHPHTVKHE